MKRKLLISVLVAVLLFTLAPFSGVLASNNCNVSNKPTSFSTSAQITQVVGTANTVQLGKSNYYRTTGEILTGSLGDCPNWEAISSATIYMQNTTFFSLDSAYNIQGIDSATITLTTADGKGTLTILAIGTLSGNYLATADITMYWTSIKATGSLKGIQANGQINATFTWFPGPPAATGTFSGTYK